VAAVASFLLANFFLTPPFHTFVVARRDEVIALLVYVVAAVVVSLTVDAGARNRAAAERSRMKAHLISTVTTGDENGRTIERKRSGRRPAKRPTPTRWWCSSFRSTAPPGADP